LPDQHHDDDTTRATARLPGLDIEIVHRRLPSGDAEQLSINLQAVPSFEAFGRFLEAANPLAWALHLITLSKSQCLCPRRPAEVIQIWS
jgi:hypothetical protein